MAKPLKLRTGKSVLSECLDGIDIDMFDKAI